MKPPAKGRRGYTFAYTEYVSVAIMDALSTILRLLGEELEEASYLIRVRSRIDLVEPYDKK